MSLSLFKRKWKNYTTLILFTSQKRVKAKAFHFSLLGLFKPTPFGAWTNINVIINVNINKSITLPNQFSGTRAWFRNLLLKNTKIKYKIMKICIKFKIMNICIEIQDNENLYQHSWWWKFVSTLLMMKIWINIPEKENCIKIQDNENLYQHSWWWKFVSIFLIMKICIKIPDDENCIKIQDNANL